MKSRPSWLLVGVTAWAIAATVLALWPQLQARPPVVPSLEAPGPRPMVGEQPAVAVQVPGVSTRCLPCGPSALSAGESPPTRPSVRELDLIKRCEQDHEKEECDQLGDLYRDGREGTVIDLVRAAKYAQLACARGHRGACRDLAEALWFGHGVPQDQRRSLQLYEQRCSDDATGCDALGLALREDGPMRDLPRALVAFQRGCAARSSFSCYLAGELLLDQKEDLQAGAAFLETACDLGSSEACEDLAHLHGRSGALPAESRVRADLERACHLGSMSACDELHVK